jgi:hypothetical protein
MKRTLLAVAVAALPRIASACPACFGDPNSAMTHGASNGVLFMLGIVGFVQVGFVALFWTFWRRARAIRLRREQFHLIEGGAR